MAAMLRAGERVKVKDVPSVKEQYRGRTGTVVGRFGRGSPGVARRIVVRLDGVRETEIITTNRSLERVP